FPYTTLFRSTRKYSVRPHLITYVSALVAAVSVEQVDDRTLREYLRVAGRVIETLPPVRAEAFFNSVNRFFKYHAIHHERTFRLYAKDDKYSFDFIESSPPVAWDDESTQDDSSYQDDFQESYDDSNYSDDSGTLEDAAYDEEEPTADTESIPLWLAPEPPPYLEGPVLAFETITLNFVTSYDSVFLKASKGTWSLTDPIFVGEGGSFDWSAAGLPPDSVYCNFLTYHFDTRKPELRSDMVRLNYVGKTPGPIPGTFEFKSEPRKDSTWSSYPKFRSYQSDLEIQGLAGDNVRYRGGFSLNGRMIQSASVNGDPATIEVRHMGEKKFTAV